MTLASVRIQMGTTDLLGYMLTDGTVQFIMGGKPLVFATVHDALKYWADTH